jgi:hypothetical protein
MVTDATDAVELIITEGAEKAMSRFNRRVQAAGTDEDM